MTDYLPIIAIWLFVAFLVCLFVHGAKKTRRSEKAIAEARRNIKWPAPRT
jgi:hypothetical protein